MNLNIQSGATLTVNGGYRLTVGDVLDVIEEAFPDRPVYLASLSDRFYASSKLVEMYCLVPENNLYRLYPKEESTLPCLGVESITD